MISSDKDKSFDPLNRKIPLDLRKRLSDISPECEKKVDDIWMIFCDWMASNEIMNRKTNLTKWETEDFVAKYCAIQSAIEKYGNDIDDPGFHEYVDRMYLINIGKRYNQ